MEKAWLADFTLAGPLDDLIGHFIPCRHAEGSGPSEEKPSRHAAMSWAKCLKRVFGIEIERCGRCAGKLKIIAGIEEPEVIAKILSHLEKTAPGQYPAELPLGEADCAGGAL